MQDRETKGTESGRDLFSRECHKRERPREREDKGERWPQWWQGFRSPIPITGINVLRGRDVPRLVLALTTATEDMPS